MDLGQKINFSGKNEKEREFVSGIPFGFSRGFSDSSKKESIEKDFEDKSNGKIVKILDLVINVSIFAIFFGLPLFFTGMSFQGISFEKQTYFYFWTLLALVAWGSKSGYIGEMKIKRTPLDIPIVAFWFFYLISTIFSVDRWHSFVGFFGDPSRGFVSITAIIIMYYLIISNFSEKLLNWIIRAIVYSGMIAIIWQIMKFFDLRFFIPESVWNSLPLSTVGSLQSSGIFACFMVIILMMRVLKIQNDDKIIPKRKIVYSVMYIAGIAASLLCVLALYNYLPIFKSFPLIGLVIGSAFFLIFVLAKIVRPKEAWTLFPMVIFILVLAFLMIGSVNISKINLPFNVSVPYGTSLEIMKGSLGDSFFLGYGPGNYGYAFSKFLPANFDNMNLRFFQGEGLLLESISNIGAIGTALFIIIILTFIGTNIFLLYREKEKNKIYSLGIISATLVILANALITQAEASIFILLLMMGILTIGTLLFESNVKEKAFSFSLKTSPKFALTLAFISLLIFASVAFLFVFFGKIFIADVLVGKATRAEKVSEEGSISKVARAISLNSKEGRYFTRLGQEYMVLTNEEMLKGEKERDIQRIQLYLNLATEAGRKGRDLMPKDVTAQENLAQIYENSGMYLLEGLEMAEKEYQRATELEPNNPFFYVRLGQIKTKMATTKEKVEDKKKLVEESVDLFKKALEKRSAYDAALYNLALSQEALGQLDESIENMTKAVSVQRNNVNYVFNLARLFQTRGKGDDNKIAESLFKQILGVNDKEINTYFNLGLLYEKTDRKNEAIKEYEKVIELLPSGSDETKNQLEKMISNIKRGVENTPENLGLVKSNEVANQEESNEENSDSIQPQNPEQNPGQ